MSVKRPIGKVEYMNKKIPKNPKYQSVKTRLDTGCSLTKYMEKMEDIKKNYRYRKDEIFRRLKVTTFAELVLQVSSVSGLLESESDGELQIPEDGLSVVSDAELDRLSEHTNSSPQPPPNLDADNLGNSTNRSTLLSVISGVGELNLDEDNKKPSAPLSSPEPTSRPYPDCPYLLLDVRDRDLYDSCHIISAHSFPIASLSRTMNPYTKEVLEYKNAAGKIIIVYDEDEMIASQAATAMCERGFENLFLLSGGLKVIAQKFPEGLTTGSIPASCRSPPASSRGKKCPSERPASHTAEKRWRFTSDELSKIQQQLDDIGSSCNSRMSSRTSSSRESKASSGRIQSSKPWK